MIKIDFKLFCSLQWKYIDITIIGDSENICFDIINKEYPLEFRYKPYNTSDKEDSLQIVDKIEENYFILSNQT